MSEKRVLFMLSHGPGSCDVRRHAGLAGRAAVAGAVLWGNGAYLGVGDHLEPLVAAGVELYALRDSVEARGLIDRVRPDVELVNYHQVVDLVMKEYDLVL